MIDLNQLINDIELINLPMLGIKFTRFNSRDGEVEQDRSLFTPPRNLG